MKRRQGALGQVLTVGGLTAFSRVLGLAREMLQSRLIGAGVEQSAFALAFAIPNMARKLFGEGALTAAFVPVFKGEVERGELEEARQLARTVMTTVLVVLGAVVVLTMAALSFALGHELSPRSVLTLKLVRLLIPYMLFICGAAFGMGVLNALGRFAEGAMMPALLNFVWIGALAGLCFFPALGLCERVMVVAGAILFGGLAQMLFLFRCLAKRGFAPRFSLRGLKSERLRLVWRNTAIAAMGAGAVQINYMLDQVLAQCAAPWAAGVIGYAERLMDLPLGVIAVAFGTVLLPTFAGLFAKADLAGAKKLLSDSVVNLMMVMLPAAAGLMVIAPEMTAAIYEGHAFDAQATVRVSRALAVYATGLGFFGYQKSIIPWFQAQNDMKTPLRVSVITVILNAALNLLAVWLLPEEWRHVGLAASTVFCAFVGCVLLTALARRGQGKLGLGAAVSKILKILLGSAVMALVLIMLKPHLQGFNAVISLAILVAAGVMAYSPFAWFFGLIPRRRPRSNATRRFMV